MKGLELELKVSQSFHKYNIPFLISSKLLRKYHGGQVDVAMINNGIIYLLEVKSSQTGRRVLYNSKQINRLRNSAIIITGLLNTEVKLKIIAKR